MLSLFCRSTIIAVIFGAVSIAHGQQQGTPEFGWSLKVEPAERKRLQSRPFPRQKAATPEGEADEIRVETDLVLSDLLIQDKNGTPVAGLRAADFEIDESGTPQKIDVFAYGDADIPRSIILVIDHSLSQLRHIDLSVESAKVLVDALRPTDQMAIVSDDIQIVADLTSDKGRLKAALESLREKCNGGRFGKSYQYSALLATLNERISRNGTRNIVIFQTDGDEFATLRRTKSPGIANFTFDDVISAAERKGVTIYSVFTGLRLADQPRTVRMEKARVELDEQLRLFAEMNGRPQPTKRSKLSREYIEARVDRVLTEEKAVNSVAERTGGIAQALESPEQAGAIYERILSDIGRRYLIGYYPPDRTDRSVREREVRITLKNQGNYRVVGGRTYIAY